MDNVEKIKTNLGLFNLPAEVNISTMTVCCKLDTIFILENIAKYLELSNTGILSIAFGDASNSGTNRSILPKKNDNKKKKKKKAFFNQVSVYVYAPLKKKKKMVNLKIFSTLFFSKTFSKLFFFRT